MVLFAENTSTSRDHLKTSSSVIDAVGKGGLSGKPIKDRALALCSKVRRRKELHQQIIGCGGIFSGDDAFDFLNAGASAVEIYTALVYMGPTALQSINRRLDQLLESEGTTVLELVAQHTRSSR